MVKLFTDLSCNILALAAGLIFWKNLRLPHRIILLQIALALGVEISAGFLMPVHNLALYKFLLLADGLILLTAGYLFLKGKSGYWIGAAMILYILYWSIAPLPADFAKVYIASSALQVIVYFFVLYHAVMSNKASLLKLPELWISIGIIVFYACNIPYFSMINLVTKLSVSKQVMLHIVLVCLSNFRYLCMTLSFYFIFKNKAVTRWA